MLYSYFVEKLVRESFDDVNDRRWDELLKPVAANVASSLWRLPLDWW